MPEEKTSMGESGLTGTDGTSVRARETTKRWPVFVTAGLVVLGSYLACVLSYGTNLNAAFFYVTFFGLPLLGIIFFLSLLAARFALRWLSARVVVFTGVVLAVGLVAWAFWDSLPTSRFKAYVISPMPASLSNLRVQCNRTFNDGHTWVFQFEVNSADFEVIRKKHRLQPIEYDLDERQRQLTELEDLQTSKPMSRENFEFLHNGIFPEDHLIRTFVRDYRRPSRPEFYRTRRKHVVRDPETGSVVMLFDCLRELRSPPSSGEDPPP